MTPPVVLVVVVVLIVAFLLWYLRKPRTTAAPPTLQLADITPLGILRVDQVLGSGGTGSLTNTGNGCFWVRPDGKVAAPLVDDIVASGKTPTQLARDLEKSLGKFVRDPVVTVIVTTFVGPSTEQIRVIGEATKPQVIAYRKNMSVLDVMIQVGGLTDFADGNAASIYRSAEGKSYSVRLRDLVKRGDITANVDMRPGDILIIPQSWF